VFARALSGVKVLDIGHYIAGPYCAKLLADYGAEVIKVEKPDGGDPARRLGPFPDDSPNAESSLLFSYLNTNKLGITLNLKTYTGKEIFKELVKKADILVENFHPRVMQGLGLSYEKLKAINPGLVMTSISNFGQRGPYSGYKAQDIVIQALSGWLQLRGEYTREPNRAGGALRMTEYVGAVFGATGTMTAFTYRTFMGAGQHVDMSLLEASSLMNCYPGAMTDFPRNPGWTTIRFIFTPSVEKCKDGYIGINTLTGAHWRDLCSLMDMPDWAENPKFNSLMARLQNREELYERMNNWLKERTREEIYADGRDWRVPIAMVYNSEDILQSPQYLARDFLVDVEHPSLGKTRQPGAPFKMSETPWRMAKPSPSLGQHNQEVYSKFLDLKNEDLVRLRQAGVI